MSNEIEIRSDEVHEIMGQSPRWITRWGTTLILSICILFLIGSWFFKYPTIITSKKIIITTENPPASVVAHANGIIDSLFVEDKQYVTANQTIALIENPAHFKDMVKLRAILDTFKNVITHLDSPTVKTSDNNLLLGEVQSNYAFFLKSYNDYLHFIQLDYHSKKIASLNEEMKRHNLYYKLLKRQSQIMKKEFTLAGKQYKRDSSLYATKYISLSDFEKSESQYLQKQYAYEQALINRSSTQITISKINQQILDLELERIEQGKQQQLTLMEAWENLHAAVSLWEQNYLLKAPINGKVSFSSFWSEYQKVTMNEVIFTVVPKKQGEMIGKLELPVRQSGKVKNGQKVNIKLANYPYLEFGIVHGIVKNISLVPEKDTYAVEVELPNGLATNFNRELEFNQEMQGEAEIITDEMRLLVRIINPLKLIWEKNLKTSN